MVHKNKQHMKNQTNKVQIIGNLGNTPELKIINNTKLTELSVAVNEVKRYKNGQTSTKTQWHKVIVWGKLAEQVQQLTKKGTKVLIEGKLDTRSFIDKLGKKRNTIRIVAHEVVVNYTQAA